MDDGLLFEKHVAEIADGIFLDNNTAVIRTELTPQEFTLRTEGAVLIAYQGSTFGIPDVSAQDRDMKVRCFIGAKSLRSDGGGTGVMEMTAKLRETCSGAKFGEFNAAIYPLYEDLFEKVKGVWWFTLLLAARSKYLWR